jgi:hypothetical protein
MTLDILIDKHFTLLTSDMSTMVLLFVFLHFNYLSIILCIKIEDIVFSMLRQNFLILTAQDRALERHIMLSNILDQLEDISVILKSINSGLENFIELISF